MALFEASIAAIVPALAVFYLTFDSYDPFLSDRGLFTSLFVGMVLGYVFMLPEFGGLLILDPFFAGPRANTTAVFGAVVSVAAIAFYQEGIRTATLNLPAIRDRWQVPFWGVSLGIGSGAVVSLLILGVRETFTTVDMITNQPLIAALILSHGAYGGLVGLGVTEARAVRGFWIASVAHMGLNGLLLLDSLRLLLHSEPLVTGVRWGLILLMLAYGAVLFRHMLRELPTLLPKDAQVRRRRMLRSAES